MILVWMVVVGLASYRLWRIPAQDSMTDWFRDWLYCDQNAVKDFLAQLVECPWCLGFWIAGAGAWLVADDQGYGILAFSLVWLGASAICGMTNTAVERLNR
jgi:hypothetical protein